jgi:hypothetical protein
VAEEFTIDTTFNGVTKPLEVEAEQQTQAVLEAAIRLFSLQSQPHTMGLFTQANVEVAGRLPSGQDIHESVEQAGITPGQLLVLRQVVVQGG